MDTPTKSASKALFDLDLINLVWVDITYKTKNNILNVPCSGRVILVCYIETLGHQNPSRPTIVFDLHRTLKGSINQSINQSGRVGPG